MTSRADQLAKANTKPGDLRAEMAKRVGLTVEEQNLCRREGFSAAVRALDKIKIETADEYAIVLRRVARMRWGPDWEVDG